MMIGKRLHSDFEQLSIHNADDGPQLKKRKLVKNDKQHPTHQLSELFDNDRYESLRQFLYFFCWNQLLSTPNNNEYISLLHTPLIGDGHYKNQHVFVDKTAATVDIENLTTTKLNAKRNTDLDEPSFVDFLPRELIHLIVGHLTFIKDIMVLTMCNHKLRKIVGSPMLWRVHQVYSIGGDLSNTPLSLTSNLCHIAQHWSTLINQRRRHVSSLNCICLPNGMDFKSLFCIWIMEINMFKLANVECHVTMFITHYNILVWIQLLENCNIPFTLNVKCTPTPTTTTTTSNGGLHIHLMSISSNGGFNNRQKLTCWSRNTIQQQQQNGQLNQHFVIISKHCYGKISTNIIAEWSDYFSVWIHSDDIFTCKEKFNHHIYRQLIGFDERSCCFGYHFCKYQHTMIHYLKNNRLWIIPSQKIKQLYKMIKCDMPTTTITNKLGLEGILFKRQYEKWKRGLIFNQMRTPNQCETLEKQIKLKSLVHKLAQQSSPLTNIVIWTKNTKLNYDLIGFQVPHCCDDDDDDDGVDHLTFVIEENSNLTSINVIVCDIDLVDEAPLNFVPNHVIFMDLDIYSHQKMEIFQRIVNCLERKMNQEQMINYWFLIYNNPIEVNEFEQFINNQILKLNIQQ